jgi:SAM-dependent methyltransferase
MNNDAGLPATLSDETWIHLLDTVERDLIGDRADGAPLTLLELHPRLGGVVTLLSDRHKALALVTTEALLSPAVESHVSSDGIFPFADESIDLLFLLDGLATDPAPARTLAEISRVLREGGQLIVAVLNPAAVIGGTPVYPELMSDSALPGLLAAQDLLLDRLQSWGPREGTVLAWLGIAVRARRSQPAQHNRLGVKLFEQGRIAAAWRHFDLAVQLDPELLDARLNRATIFRLAGRTERYREELQDILRCDPEHEGARAALNATTSATANQATARLETGDPQRDSAAPAPLPAVAMSAAGSIESGEERPLAAAAVKQRALSRTSGETP